MKLYVLQQVQFFPEGINESQERKTWSFVVRLFYSSLFICYNEASSATVFRRWVFHLFYSKNISHLYFLFRITVLYVVSRICVGYTSGSSLQTRVTLHMSWQNVVQLKDSLLWEGDKSKLGVEWYIYDGYEMGPIKKSTEGASLFPTQFLQARQKEGIAKTIECMGSTNGLRIICYLSKVSSYHKILFQAFEETLAWTTIANTVDFLRPIWIHTQTLSFMHSGKNIYKKCV